MTPPWRVLLGMISVALLVAGCGKPSAPVTSAPSAPARAPVPAAELTVYVPCGMELPFTAAQKAFEAAQPGSKVGLVLDNANILVKRVLERDEKPDLIVTPGTIEMQALVKAGRVREVDVRHFGKYELVLFGPRANPAGIAAIRDLTKPEVKTIALADPEANSVGRYTRQALQAMGLWDQVQGKLLLTDHPITAYQHVAREKAEASFAYRSCPLKTAPDKLEYSKVRIIESVPQNLYDPAYACIAPLTATPRRQLADVFTAFLLSEAGQKIMREYDIPPVAANQLSIFVPCGMIGPFHNVKARYEAMHPELKIELDFDRADALTDRILKQGARPDLHLSIGHVEAELLVKAGLVAREAPVALGRFRLALCTHVSRKGTLTCLEDLAKPEVASILLTPPETSSVGAYAKTALTKVGLWEKVAGKVKYLPTIKDCYKELAAGRADAGFAYIGCPLPADPAKAEYSKVMTVQVLDEQLYGGAVVFASVLTESPNRAQAEAFLGFLKTPEAMTLLDRIGLQPLAR